MLALAGTLGRQVAHEILKAHAGAPDFVAALKGDTRVAGALPGAKLDELLDPTTYVGLAPLVVSKVVAAFGRAPAGGGGGGAK
jgi:adenylosuccinate lyase